MGYTLEVSDQLSNRNSHKSCPIYDPLIGSINDLNTHRRNLCACIYDLKVNYWLLACKIASCEVFKFDCRCADRHLWPFRTPEASVNLVAQTKFLP